MRPRTIVFAIAAVAVLVSVGAWAATGAKPFTRFENKENTEVNAQNELGDLFADTEPEGDQVELGKIDSGFAFGLLPAGPGKASLSVAAVAGVAVFVSAAAWFFDRKKKGAAQTADQGDSHGS